MEQTTDTYYRAWLTRDTRFDGRVFAGVRTTGIYCRPVCPARMPKRENMTFFPTAAAAAEAGFRPCLRCRPETAPDFAGWRGASPVVHRALALIEDGWLEDRDIDGLAGQVGVSGRQLRRLFRERLGATPVAVAQTRRVLLAKQLIHETALSMVDVAMASGFGSVRRFNETFQQLFDRPPQALRRQSVIEAATGTGIAIRLPYRPPYDWDAMLASLGRTAIPGVERVADGEYARTVRIGDHAGWITVGPGTGDRLALTVHFPDLSALPRVIGRVRRRFDLSADPVAIAGQLGEDPLLAPLVAARPGLRVPGVWDGFEEAIRTIVQEDTRHLGAIVATHGRPVDGPTAEQTGLTRTFPEPSDLARLEAGTDGRVPDGNLTSIAGFAAAVASEPTLLAQHREPDAARRRLQEISGIDERLAAAMVSRILEGYDAIPLDPATFPRGDPSVTLAEASRDWSPWRAYGFAYLLTDRHHTERYDSAAPSTEEVTCVH